jgi:plastocyanin
VRRRHALLLGAALPLAAAAPAGAAQVEVKAVEPAGASPVWDKAEVDVALGDTVRWSFDGTQQAHNVEAAVEPGFTSWSGLDTTTQSPAPPATWTFNEPGTYLFVCEVHKDSMRGYVRVAGAPPPPPPPPGQQPFPNDGVAPAALETGGLDTTKPSLRYVRVQRSQRGARIRFRVSERARVTVRFKRGRKVVKTRHVNAVGSERLTVRGKALRAGRYRVELSAEDVAGNRSGVRTARFTMR